MSWTRRTLGREIVSAVRYPLRMFEGKSGKPSMHRIIIFGSAVMFWRYWPQTWSDSSRDAFALMLFALPIADLFAMIPAAEALAAMQSFFMATVGKVSGLIPGTTTKTQQSSTETTTAPVASSQPPAVDPPHEWAEGEPHAGLG